ncbi:MAG TPA: hypothetical protein VGD81_10230 [Opitutaceae bacterium]
MSFHFPFPDKRRFVAWLRQHRPLAWVETLLPDYLGWAPDPPVIERLIR